MKSIASYFVSQQTVNTNTIIVKMSEKYFVQTKTFLIDVNFLLCKKGLLLIWLVGNFKENFRGGQEKAKVFWHLGQPC